MTRLHYIAHGDHGPDHVQTSCGRVEHVEHVTGDRDEVTCFGCRRAEGWMPPAGKVPSRIIDALRRGPMRPCDVAREAGCTTRRVSQVVAREPRIRATGRSSDRVLRWVGR